jgi:hypothetical protein
LIDWKTSTANTKKLNAMSIDDMYDDPIQLAAYIGAVNSDASFNRLPMVNYSIIVFDRKII